MANDAPRTLSIFVEATSGEKFEADVSADTPLETIASDFFESQGWKTRDSAGRGQRAVVELVDPNNPGNTKRLNGEHTLKEAGIHNGDTLRVFPESIAGVTDQRARHVALIQDHNDMRALSERTSEITFTANRTHAPDRYEITLDYPSFSELPAGASRPRVTSTHRVEIILNAAYPRFAPWVRWLTPIFHPNIRQSDGAVCLGVLQDRYLPGLGLARLVWMLAEMLQWRNFDATNPFNQAAADWAADPEHWEAIETIGGHPFQGSIEQLLEKLGVSADDLSERPRIQFRALN